MKKIISLFQRNYETDHLVRNELVPGAEWVLAGEGIPTRKWDGTCCMIQEAKLYKRYEVKPGKTPPDNFVPANEIDENTGKQQGWLPVGDGPDDKFHNEAFYRLCQTCFDKPLDGTYELVGPKIQGNRDKQWVHALIPHGKEILDIVIDCEPELAFDHIREYLIQNDAIEGIVWHHDDGRMVKIKAKDFGLKR